MKTDFLAHFLWKVDESRLDAGYATTTGGKKDRSFTWITWRPVITMSSPIESTFVRVPKTARAISQELGELGGNRISECFPVQPLPLVANGVDTHQTSSKCSAICWNLLRCPLKHQASLQTVMKDLRNCSNSMNSLNTRVLVQSPPFYPPANSNHLADRRLGLETPMEWKAMVLPTSPRRSTVYPSLPSVYAHGDVQNINGILRAKSSGRKAMFISPGEKDWRLVAWKKSNWM